MDRACSGEVRDVVALDPKAARSTFLFQFTAAGTVSTSKFDRKRRDTTFRTEYAQIYPMVRWRANEGDC